MPELIIFIIFMAVCAIEDFKTKKIDLRILIGFIVSGMVIFIIRGENSALEGLLAVSVGGAFLAASLISHGKIGIGDGLFLIGAGLYLGFDNLTLMLVFGSVLSAIFAVVMVLLKKKGKGEEIPFVPFLAGGYVISAICMKTF